MCGILTTPSRPVVIEVVLSCVEYLQHCQGLLSLRYCYDVCNTAVVCDTAVAQPLYC